MQQTDDWLTIRSRRHQAAAELSRLRRQRRRAMRFAFQVAVVVALALGTLTAVLVTLGGEHWQ